MGVHDTQTKPNKKEIYRLYEAGEIPEEKARRIIGDDWNAIVTGAMMEEDLQKADWDVRYDDESVF